MRFRPMNISAGFIIPHIVLQQHKTSNDKERRISRLQYHYAIRYAVKENMRIRNNKMADAVSKNNDRILWDTVRKMSKINKELPQIIDGHSNVEEVNDIFANKNKIFISIK